MQPTEDYVLRLLEEAGLVTRALIENAKSRLNGSGNTLDLLIKEGIVSDSDVSHSLAAQADMDWVDLSAQVIPPYVINQIRAEDARRFKVIPVGYGESGLIVAVTDPLDIDTIDSLSFLLQRELELVCASPEKIRQA
ncbi:MAG TPA: type II/IV secretion system protein, partial [Chthoniobacterales bacterium]|nr:type II/IV secretion system protein [Chthoniobacterales bacterium]